MDRITDRGAINLKSNEIGEFLDLYFEEFPDSKFKQAIISRSLQDGKYNIFIEVENLK